MIKNATGQHISFIAIATADGAAVTTGTPTVYLSKDGAAQATSSNTASHLGNGVWVLDLTQAETNAAHLSAVMVLTNAVNSFAQAFPVVQADFKADVSALALSRHYTFNNSSGSDYVDVYLNNDAATNFPKVQKAIVRLKISGSVASSSDWRLKLHPPSGGPSGGFDLISGVTLSTSLSNEIIQTEVDLTDADVVDGSWSIVLQDFNTSGNVLSINDAEIEFSDVPASIGDATAANQTSISSAISALNDFDPAADTVSNVTTVGSVTSAVTTSNASDVTAIKAVTDNLPDSGSLTSLATAASISALNDFDPTTQTVTTDAASRTASQADVSSLATAASISSLNDFDPASDTVANVTTVGSVTNAVTTSNAADVTAIKSVTDKIDTALVQDGSVYQYTTNALENAPSGGLTQADVRAAVGLASANLDTQLSTIDTVVDAVLVDTGTDIPASISALNDFNPATQAVTTDAASRTASQADVSLLATAASIAALNDFDASTDMVIVSTNNDKSGYALSTAGEDALVDKVFDEILSGHNVAGSFAKMIRHIYEGVVSTDGAVDDTGATATTFITNLSESTDGFYHDKVIVFSSGSLTGQARHIETYVGSTKSVTVSQAFTAAPADGDEFLILATHEHSLTEIAEAARTELDSNSTKLASIDGVTAKIDTSMEQDGSVYRFTTNALEQAPTGSGQSGSGAIEHEITVNVGGSPEAGVDVWVSTDAAGNNIVAGTLVTDAFGNATFSLDAGSYYLWAQKAGANFTNPTSFTVS